MRFFGAILIYSFINKHVDEKSTLWRIKERDAIAESILILKQPKTTSEWTKNVPVIPLPS